MALKNLFDMVKADRYTADGREELNKAQEEETEDKVYQIGEISQKTGLQKTANGWVKPKNGAAPAKKQEKKGAGIPQATTETFVGKTYKDFVESATPSGYKPTKNTDNPDGSSTTVFEKEGKQIKVEFDKNGKITKVSPGEKKGEKAAAAKPTLSQTDGKGNKVEIKITESKGGGFYIDKYVNGKHIGINNANTRESAEAKAKSMMEQHMADPDYKAEEKPAGTRHAEKRKTNRPKAIRWDRNNLNEMRGNEEYINAKAADNYYHQYGLDKIGEWKDRKGWTVKEYQNDDGETYRAKYNGEKYVGSEYDPTGEILSPENKDAAPRVLTGDTKIRVRKA